ncbi:MAG: DUF2946 family protein [Pseudomonadota bacterium]
MQRLRNAATLARWVLVWFALSLGVAVASPLVKPQAVDLVCSAGGAIKLVVKGEMSDGTTAASHTLDCPLCIPLAAPPPAAQVVLPAPQPLGRAVQPIPAARIAALTAAPLPARGPPPVLIS